MTVSRPNVQHTLTEAQARLLARHARGLRRLAGSLAVKNGFRPEEIMFVLADRTGRIGRAISATLSIASIGPSVLPGRAAELDAWVERLAIHGPVWDLSGVTTGIPVVVVDADDVMAVVRLVEHST